MNIDQVNIAQRDQDEDRETVNALAACYLLARERCWLVRMADEDREEEACLVQDQKLSSEKSSSLLTRTETNV